MYDVAELPESKLEALLSTLGLLGSLDIGGVALAPLVVQIAQYNPGTPSTTSNDRILAIIASGSNNIANSVQYDDLNVTIVISSIADRTDSINAKMIALLISDTLTDYKDASVTPDDGDIFGLIPSGVNGPFYEDGGRVVYEVSLSLLINR